MNIAEEARRDAREYARAKMSHGQGAGTRRKLIQATVDSRGHQNPEYARLFHIELGKQNMAEHAHKAQVEHSRRMRKQALSKNTKGVLTGNPRSMHVSVLVVLTAAYLAHETGLDRKIYYKGKQVIANLEYRRQAHKRRRKYEENVQKVTRLY